MEQSFVAAGPADPQSAGPASGVVSSAPAEVDESVAVLLARQSKSRWRRLFEASAGPLVILAVIIGVWYLVSYVVLSPSRRFLLPPLHQVIQQAFLTSANLSVLMSALAVTAEVAMTGLALAIVIGVAIAVAMSEAKSVERGFYPYLVVLQTIPILALVPLIGFWLGFGFGARVVVCVLISLFPIIANTLFGLQSPTLSYHELFDLHRTGRVIKLVKLKLPMALPSILNGFRISAGLSVIGEIVGGYFFQQGTPDIGVLLEQFTSQLNGEMLFGAILLAAMLGVVVFWVFGAMGALFVGRWKE